VCGGIKAEIPEKWVVGRLFCIQKRKYDLPLPKFKEVSSLSLPDSDGITSFRRSTYIFSNPLYRFAPTLHLSCCCWWGCRERRWKKDTLDTFTKAEGSTPLHYDKRYIYMRGTCWVDIGIENFAIGKTKKFGKRKHRVGFFIKKSIQAYLLESNKVFYELCDLTFPS